MIEPIQITWPIILGTVGGLLGALRASAYAMERGSWVKAITNISIGIASATAVSGHFVHQQQPWMGLLLGIATGASGGYVLDALQAVVPSVARDGIRTWVRRFLGLPEQQQEEKQ